MSGLHVWPADGLFSQYIRARDRACQRCFLVGPLDCSHWHTRRDLRTRWDAENSVSLCRNCHNYMARHPREHRLFFEQRLGEERFAALLKRINEPLALKVAPAAEAKRLRELLKAQERSEEISHEGA